MEDVSINKGLVFDYLEKCYNFSSRKCNIHRGLRRMGHDISIGKVNYAIKLLIDCGMVEKDGYLIKIAYGVF